MSIDLAKLHELEQKAMALMTFIASHMSQVQKAKDDIADLFKQISILRSESQQKLQG